MLTFYIWNVLFCAKQSDRQRQREVHADKLRVTVRQNIDRKWRKKEGKYSKKDIKRMIVEGERQR